jgi:MarR family transcriptional regulator, lower aerobic nicotinate degradation pathway regulator
MPTTRSRPIDLASLPGHHIRRLHQIAVAVFLQEMEPTGLTPVQYAVLQSVHNVPGVDQRTLAGTIGQDTSTTGGVLDRLEARGLLQRSPSADDRRVRLLTLTAAGQDLLAQAIPHMQRAQERMLQPLPKRERVEFMRMLQTLVNANNELSRAPSDGG